MMNNEEENGGNGIGWVRVVQEKKKIGRIR